MKRDNWVGFVPFYLLAVIVSLGLVFGISDSVTAMHKQDRDPRNHCIIIDAGHGGIDGGATSCTGVLESAINLEIAHRLNDMMHLFGYKTYMIRTTDTSIYTTGNTIASQKVSDLKERVRIVNETPNAVLISIHQNTFSDSRYGGAQVFYSDNEDSVKLAKDLQSSIKLTLNREENRSAKAGKGIYLLQNIKKTGILVECGFLSNPKEEAKLRSAAYQRDFCGVIAATLTAFLT